MKSSKPAAFILSSDLRKEWLREYLTPSLGSHGMFGTIITFLGDHPAFERLLRSLAKQVFSHGPHGAPGMFYAYLLTKDNNDPDNLQNSEDVWPSQLIASRFGG